MIELICTEKQVSTQLARHCANALLAAPRRGPMREAVSNPLSVPKNIPFQNRQMRSSPHFASLRSVHRRLERLQNPPDLQKRAQLIREKEMIEQLIRAEIYNEAQWPYVAGLYAVRVPPIALIVDGEKKVYEEKKYTVTCTVSDNDPIWPHLSKLLVVRPQRWNNPVHPNPFRIKKYEGQKIYTKQDALSKIVAQWLIEQVTQLAMSEKFAA